MNISCGVMSKVCFIGMFAVTACINVPQNKKTDPRQSCTGLVIIFINNFVFIRNVNKLYPHTRTVLLVFSLLFNVHADDEHPDNVDACVA